MYKVCKSVHALERQQMLEQCLLSAMEQGKYSELYISDLCNQAGVPRKAFYRYFSGKEGALFSLIDHTIWNCDWSWCEVPGNTTAILRLELESFFEYWIKQEKLFRVLDQNDLLGLMLQRVALQPSAFQQTNSCAQDFLRSSTIRFISSGLMAMILQWYQSDFSQSVEEMAWCAAEIIKDMLIYK